MGSLPQSKRSGLWSVFVVLLSGLLVGVMLLLTGGQTARAQPDVFYVDVAATGPTQDGLSWTTAFTNVQDALAVAAYGDEVWVAAGVYTPDEGAGQTDGDRESTFGLEPGVALYGGFEGTEEARDERDWTTNVTVLSGDIDGDDGTDANGVVTDPANIVGDNAYHVATGEGVTETAVLDGFTITGGLANGPEWRQAFGGGMYNEGSSPTLRDVTFSGNHADEGGGMCNYDNSAPTLTNVVFSGNTASDGGGGMYNRFSSSPALTNVVFSGNRADGPGGGMYNRFWGSPSLTNVTFTGNHAADEGGGMSNHQNSSPTLVNAILWGNSPDSIFSDTTSSATITYSDIEGGFPGEGNIDQDPQFVAPVAATSAPTTEGNYRLRYDSPAIDAGNTLSVTAATDLDGNPRVVGEQVDMGAYEYQAYTLTVARVGEGDVTEAPDWPTYTYLDEVVLTATPDPGWTFVGWSGDVGGAEEVITHTIVGNTLAVATFELIPYTLEVDTVGEGEVAVEPEQESYFYGDVVTLTATADTGWFFEGWSGDVEDTNEVITHTIRGNTVVTATFEAIPYSLEVNIVGEGDVAVEPEEESYFYGDVITLTAIADTGWLFESWSGDVIGTGEVVTHTILGDTVVTATFEAVPYTLEVNIVGEGVVEIEPQQDSYVYGDVVTLTATADTGWLFDRWGGDVEGTEEVVTHTIEGDTVVTATFEAIPYSLEVNIVGGGGVAVEPEQGSYVYADVITLTATADPGWTFVAWSGDVMGTEEVVTHTIAGDTVVTATFELIPYSLEVDIVGEGAVQVEPEQDSYFYGDVVTLTATADTGWHFDRWNGDVEGTDEVITHTIVGDTVVTATFELIAYTLVVNIVGEGDVEVEPEQDSYAYGDVVTLTAIADPGWTFVGWSGRVISTDNPLQLTMRGDTTITATFEGAETKVYLPLVARNE